MGLFGPVIWVKPSRTSAFACAYNDHGAFVTKSVPEISGATSPTLTLILHLQLVVELRSCSEGPSAVRIYKTTTTRRRQGRVCLARQDERKRLSRFGKNEM